MSQEINNREYRQEVIRSLLAQLHEGKTAEEVKQQFKEAFDGVSASEISAAEQALISGGMPVEEVQKLCDVHAAVFKDSIEVSQTAEQSEVPGHPVYVFKQENRAFEKVIAEQIRPGIKELTSHSAMLPEGLAQGLKDLLQIDLHYIKKENLLFPYLERYGITAPPQVMWGVDDEIRLLVKEAAKAADAYDGDAAALVQKTEAAISQVEEMIFKEDNILFPMLLETLTQDEWKQIAQETGDLGYVLISPPPPWNPPAEESVSLPQQAGSGTITLPTGVFQLEELTRMLDTLPMDITFVGADDTVRYFSQGTERIFPRTKAVIGRKVINCHPPGSMHVVEKIVEDLKSGKKDHEDFWIPRGDKFILIRYFAVRDEQGKYLGTLEVTQNIAPLQEIKGEKRLLSEE